MGLVGGRKLDGLRWALSSGPEGGTIRIDVVEREVVEELLGGVVVSLLEIKTSELDAVIKGLFSLQHASLESLKGRQLKGRIQCINVVRFGQVVVNNIGILDEVALEGVLASPLKAVLDVVGERVQQAHRGLFRGRVAGRTIGLSQIGNDDLNVTLRGEGSGLEEGLGVVHAATVDVKASSNVVQGIADAIKLAPEFLVIGTLGFRSSLDVPGVNVHVGVHLLDGGGSGERFHLPNVPGTVEELAVQVGDFDGVHIGDVDVAIGTSTKSHHSPVLEHLATNGTSTNKEVSQIKNELVVGAAENGDLAVVAGVERGSVLLRNLHRGQALKTIKVEELVNRGVLGGSGLDDLLGNDTTEEGTHGGQVTSRSLGESGDKFVVDRGHLIRRWNLRVDILGQLNNSGGVGFGVRLRVAVVLLDEQEEGLQVVVVLSRTIKLRIIAHLNVGELNRLVQEGGIGLEAHGAGLLYLLHKTALDVVTKSTGITNGELERALDIDAELLTVDFGHALNLSDADGVTILEVVALRLNNGNNTLLVFSNKLNVRALGLLTVVVVDGKGLAKVYEDVAEQARNTSSDERDIVLVAKVVDADKVIARANVGQANNLDGRE
jgi:hypothetical protein